MPQPVRLLIESVYREDIVTPDGLVKTEQAQLAKYYCDHVLAHQILPDFKSRYNPDNNDFLADKLFTCLAEESVMLWLAKSVDGQLPSYACGAYPWEMSMLRMRKSWWHKHKTEFTLLTEKSLQQ